MNRAYTWIAQGLSLCTLTGVLVLLYSLEQVIPWWQLPDFIPKPQLLLCAVVAVHMLCSTQIGLVISALCWAMHTAGHLTLGVWLPLYYLVLAWWIHRQKTALRKVALSAYLPQCALALVLYRILFMMHYITHINAEIVLYIILYELISTLVCAIPIYGLVVAVTAPLREKYAE